MSSQTPQTHPVFGAKRDYVNHRVWETPNLTHYCEYKRADTPTLEDSAGTELNTQGSIDAHRNEPLGYLTIGGNHGISRRARVVERRYPTQSPRPSSCRREDHNHRIDKARERGKG